MKYLLIILTTAFFFFPQKTCSAQSVSVKTWAGARWIALEQLADSMKVVPAVHGSGNELGNKCISRSVVPMFRKDFVVEKEIDKAIINISGLGHYELFVNGSKAGDRFLSPGWTNFRKRILYNTLDITDHLNNGKNTLGMLVGNGFYNINRERYRKLVGAFGYPKLIFNLELKFKDGTVKNIISDEKCRVFPSPVLFSSIYGGEDYDARLEQKGWSNPDFDDSQWNKPVICDDDTSLLEPETDHPLRVMQEFNVKHILTSKTGRTVYDFGQNASGIIALKVRGNKGAKITFRPDELINTEGNVTQRSGGGPYEFNYILNGEGVENWQPKFTYYGFRYADVEIIEPEGAKNKTEILELKMLHTRNSAPTVGSFSCSDSLFNKIFELINWGIKSNMASVATDCPHREKLGWLEQTYLIGPSMHYNFDIHSFYGKIVTDMMDSQLENGLVPDIAPEYVPFQGGFRDSPEWGSAAVIIPWQLYQWYGDVSVLSKAYPMMKRYVEYLAGKAEKNILSHGLGDWYDLGPKHPGEAQLTPKAVTATSIYFYDLQIVSKVAGLIGKTDDSQALAKQGEIVRNAFLEKFYDAKNGVCSTGSQTAFAMSLYTGLIPEKDKEKVLNNLVDSIVRNDYALTAGDIGYHFLVRVLSENGLSDLLYRMNNRSDRPGYGYQLKKGATSLTESWAALTDVSNNHMMLGHLMEWFYNGLGGIYQAENSVAYKKIIIAPKPVGNIRWVKCSFKSPNGVITSDWEKSDHLFSLKIEIPENTKGTVVLPDEYRNADIEIINLKSGKEEEITTKNGAFDIGTGAYSIKAH